MEDADCDVTVGYYRGTLERFLAGLEVIRPALENAVLELDGDSRELEMLVEERTRSLPELAELNRRARGKQLAMIRFRRGPAVLPIEDDTFEILRSMLERHADPEIAMELIVRDSVGCLVWAPDVGDNEIWASSRLPAASIDALRGALGDGLTPD